MNLETLPKEGLANVSSLAQLQLKLANEIAVTEERLEDLKEKYKAVSEYELPDAMAAIEMKELVLADGSKIKVEPYYGASITKENQVAAFNWLNENGFGSLIKHEITISFSKGEEKLVQAVKSMLETARLAGRFSDKATVHPSTLKAFVREQMEDGAPIPHDLLGVHVGQKTTIKN